MYEEYVMYLGREYTLYILVDSLPFSGCGVGYKVPPFYFDGAVTENGNVYTVKCDVAISFPLRPQNWGTGENQLKLGKNDAAQLQTPKP
jgi:hypothetical protein